MIGAYYVSTKDRRRLWGGDMPDDWWGPTWKLLGGHNYAYKMPGDGSTVDLAGVPRSKKKVETYLWRLSAMGAFITVFALVANLTIHWRESLYFAAVCFVRNEWFTWNQVQNPERLIGISETGRLISQAMYGMPKRLMSGFSLVYNGLVAYPIYHRLFVGTALGWLPRWCVLGIVGSNIRGWWQDRGAAIRSATAHAVHFAGIVWGLMDLFFLRWLGRYLVRLGGSALRIPGQFIWGLLSVAGVELSRRYAETSFNTYDLSFDGGDFS